MRLSKKQREKLLRENCGTINSDDAVDPRHYFYNKRKSKNKFRKVFQLTRQASETLQLVMTEGDEALDGLNIVDVVPAPDSRRFLVIVSIDASSEVESASHVEAIMQLLQAQIPRLRSEIARTINRRKTPQLIFEIANMKPKK